MMFEGQVESIHRAPAGSAPMELLTSATLVAGEGIAGDRYATGLGHYSGRPHVDRQVTLLEAEVLEALSRDHGVELAPSEHRRNVTTSGVPVGHLVGAYFSLGACVLYGGRLNVPCAYLDSIVGRKVWRSLVHRSGLNARIIVGGTVSSGDRMRPVDPTTLDQTLVEANEQTPIEPAPDVV